MSEAVRGNEQSGANPFATVDIINVVSVTQQATVNQVTDENDDQIQSALYWRQAFDVRTQELSVRIRAVDTWGMALWLTSILGHRESLQV